MPDNDNSAAATIASEDEDYKHMEDVEEEDNREPVQLRGRFQEQREARNRRFSDEYVRKPSRRPKKSAWTEQRGGERMRYGVCKKWVQNLLYTQAIKSINSFFLQLVIFLLILHKLFFLQIQVVEKNNLNKSL